MRTSQVDIIVDDGTHLSVLTFENGSDTAAHRNLVLLHGWPNAGRVWSALATVLLPEVPGLHLIAPTFRGYGDSEHTDTGFDCARFAADILSIARTLNLPDFTLVGHSMGGKIAQFVAAQQPEGLTSLILLSPAFASAAAVPEERRAAQKAIYGNREGIRKLIRSMTASPIDEETLNFLEEDGLKVSRSAFDGWIDAMREEDFADRLQDIAVPTLVLHGEKDPLRTQSAIEQNVVKPIAGARLMELPDVGHLALIETPGTLSRRILEFLQEPNR